MRLVRQDPFDGIAITRTGSLLAHETGRFGIPKRTWYVLHLLQLKQLLISYPRIRTGVGHIMVPIQMAPGKMLLGSHQPFPYRLSIAHQRLTLGRKQVQNEEDCHLLHNLGLHPFNLTSPLLLLPFRLLLQQTCSISVQKPPPTSYHPYIDVNPSL
jgi:hypothetical protein